MEARKAEQLTFTVKEAVDILLAHARTAGGNLPPVYENASLNIDGSKGTVVMTIVCPLGWKGQLDA